MNSEANEANFCISNSKLKSPDSTDSKILLFASEIHELLLKITSFVAVIRDRAFLSVFCSTTSWELNRASLLRRDTRIPSAENFNETLRELLL